MRPGASSGIDIRRKSKEQKSRMSYVGRMSPTLMTNVCTSQQTWNNQCGSGAEPVTQPPSRLQNGQDLDSFEASDECVTGADQSTMNNK